MKRNLNIKTERKKGRDKRKHRQKTLDKRTKAKQKQSNQILSQFYTFFKSYFQRNPKLKEYAFLIKRVGGYSRK